MLQNLHRTILTSSTLVNRICARYRNVFNTSISKRKQSTEPVPSASTSTTTTTTTVLERAKPVLNMASKAVVAEAKHHDVLLYATSRHQAKWFHTMNACALSQLGCWLFVGAAFLDMKPVQISEETRSDESVSWWRKLNVAKYKDVLAAGSFAIAVGVLSLSWWHTARSVHHIVLRKGGHHLTFGMRLPMSGGQRYVTVPLDQVSSVVGRLPGPTARVQVQGKRWRYLVDTEGTFHRPGLYDRIVGVKRF